MQKHIPLGTVAMVAKAVIQLLFRSLTEFPASKLEHWLEISKLCKTVFVDDDAHVHPPSSQYHVSDPTNWNRSRFFFLRISYMSILYLYYFDPCLSLLQLLLWPLSVYIFLNFLLLLYAWLYMCDTAFVWKSKDRCMDLILSTSVWVPAIELQYSSYIASTFIWWAVLLADQGDLVAFGAHWLSRTFVQDTSAIGTLKRRACECGWMAAPVLYHSLVSTWDDVTENWWQGICLWWGGNCCGNLGTEKRARERGTAGDRRSPQEVS